MATDREAARRQRLRGAQIRDIVDADTSFGFRLPTLSTTNTTVVAAETTIEAQIATPTPAAGSRRGGRAGIGGIKRSSPTIDTIDENTISTFDENNIDQTREPTGESTAIAAQIENAAKRQRTGTAVVYESTSRVAGRNQRLRGAQLRSPGVSTQDFGFTLPPAPAPVAPVAPSIATTDTDIVQPADFILTAAVPDTSYVPQAPDESTLRVRDVTPELQVLGDSTNLTIRSSGSRTLRSSARRQRSQQARSTEVSESPEGKPGSGRRVPAEEASRRLSEAVGTPTRSGRVSVASPTLTVERPRDARPEMEDDEDVEMDELSPDRPKAQRPSPRRRIADEEVSLESVRESIEGKEDEAEEVSDEAAAAALRRNRAPAGAYIEKRPGVDDEEDDDASDQYEESVDEEAEADTLTAAQQRKRLAKVGRKNKHGDVASPAVQKTAKNKTAARSEAAARADDFMAPRKRGRPKGSKNSVKSGTGGRPKTKRQDMGPRSKETIAVQTYRLSAFNPPELDAEIDDDMEIFAQPIPVPPLPRATGGVNSIDVLSQILNEVLQSALESLEQGAQQAEVAAQRRQTPEKVAERREYRTKLRAVEAWGEAASGRLMEMGLGLDAAVGMGRRVKEAERERLELRERLSEIRKERERVGVRGDGVRSRHEREGGKREVDRRLQNAIEGVNVVVGVCREAGDVHGDEEMERADVITRLQAAAEMVGSKTEGESGGNSDGLLDRLRRMNGLLERAARALEGR